METTHAPIGTTRRPAILPPGHVAIRETDLKLLTHIGGLMAFQVERGQADPQLGAVWRDEYQRIIRAVCRPAGAPQINSGGTP